MSITDKQQDGTKKFVLISPKNRTVYNFRGALIGAIQNRGYEVIVTGPDKTDVERVEALGVRFVEIPMNKIGTSPVGDLKYCWQLYKLLRREKPDATLGYTVKPVIYGAIAARFAGVKNVNGLVTGGGYTFTAKTAKAKLLGLLVRFLYRIGFLFTNHVIFQNEDDKAEFCARGLTKIKKCSTVSGSGVDIGHFSPAPLPEEPVFFMLSRLLISKGVREYLEAARKVKAECPEAKFLLLGKYEQTMQDAVPKEEIEPYISDGIVGRFEETNDVRPYYAQCSIYVLPSYREGTPRTVLEAMAMGRPVITTDAPGCRQTVIDGETGFLVPVGDSDALAEKMIDLIRQPARIKEMGEKGRRYAEETYDVQKVNAEMLKIMTL